MQIPLDRDLADDVLVVRSRVGDVRRVERCRCTEGYDKDENSERRKREVVPTQAPPGEVLRAAATDRPRLRLSELGRRIEGELGLTLLDHPPPSPQDAVGAPYERHPHH